MSEVDPDPQSERLPSLGTTREQLGEHMNKAQMLRLLQEYPLDDEFEWKWFGTFKFPDSTTLQNAGKVLLKWRNELEEYEGTDR